MSVNHDRRSPESDRQTRGERGERSRYSGRSRYAGNDRPVRRMDRADAEWEARKRAREAEALKRKKKKRRKRILITVEILILLVLIGGAFILSKLGKLNFTGLGNVTTYADSGPYTNIALFGLDSRDGELSGGVNSDTMVPAFSEWIVLLGVVSVSAGLCVCPDIYYSGLSDPVFIFWAVFRE